MRIQSKLPCALISSRRHSDSHTSKFHSCCLQGSLTGADAHTRMHTCTASSAVAKSSGICQSTSSAGIHSRRHSIPSHSWIALLGEFRSAQPSNLILTNVEMAHQ